MEHENNKQISDASVVMQAFLPDGDKAKLWINQYLYKPPLTFGHELHVENEGKIL